MEKKLFALTHGECPGCTACFGYIIIEDRTLGGVLMPIFQSRELAELAADRFKNHKGNTPKVIEVSVTATMV